MDITSRKLASTISFFAILDSLSPFWILLTNFLKSEIGKPIFLLCSTILSLISKNPFLFFFKKIFQFVFSFKIDSKFGLISFPR